MTASSSKTVEPGRLPQGHIGWGEAMSLALAVVLPKAFLVFPQRMSVSAQTAAWSVPLFSGALSALWIWALVALMKSHPGQDLIAVTRSVACPAASVLTGAAFVVYVAVESATGARETADALLAVILPRTPVNLATALMHAVATYLALKGLENLARVAAFGTFSVVGLILLLSLLSIREWDLKTLFPLLGPGLPELGKTYFVRQAVFGEFLSLGFFGAYLRNAGEIGKTARRGLGIAALLLSLVVMNCQMTFPYPSLDDIPQPLLRVTRLIYLGRFFQRFDPFFVPVWLAAGVLKTAVGILLGALALGSILSVKRLNLLVVVVSAATYAGAALIPSFALATILDFDILRPYSVILLDVWVPGLLLLDLVKRRKARKGRIKP